MRSKSTATQKALNLWAIILIAWALYRTNFQMPEWFDELVAKPVVFITPVWYYIRSIERKKFLDGLWFQAGRFGKDIIEGVLIGAMFFASATLANFVKLKKFTLIHPLALSGQTVGYMVVIAIGTAVSEEILSRGFILKRLYEESRNMYTSSFFASILFFFLHIPILFTNPKINGSLLIVLVVTDMVLSFINSVVFLQRKSLTLPILIHAFYNLAIVLFL
ncbi:CPBP family intramembrane metalloprotease [Candidatus Roizmanbacteria bacterium]|nr:CPBP family intramembrane metalloprotease [Candidatus Roizmanbacteria bacterium]